MRNRSYIKRNRILYMQEYMRKYRKKKKGKIVGKFENCKKKKKTIIYA